MHFEKTLIRCFLLFTLVFITGCKSERLLGDTNDSTSVVFNSFDRIEVRYIAFLGPYADIVYCKDSTIITVEHYDVKRNVKLDSTSTAVFLKLLKKGVFDNKPIDKYENMTITDCPDVEIRCYRKAKMKYHKWISYGSGTLTREYEPFDKWLVNLINQIIESADNQ